jgi:hypothetical protein
MTSSAAPGFLAGNCWQGSPAVITTTVGAAIHPHPTRPRRGKYGILYVSHECLHCSSHIILLIYLVSFTNIAPSSLQMAHTGSRGVSDKVRSNTCPPRHISINIFISDIIALTRSRISV